MGTPPSRTRVNMTGQRSFPQFDSFKIHAEAMRDRGHALADPSCSEIIATHFPGPPRRHKVAKILTSHILHKKPDHRLVAAILRKP